METVALAVFQSLGYEFKKLDLITEALTHRSYAHEKKLKYNNERLEFLGDTVLDLTISQLLCEAFPDSDEGTLSALRSQFVSEACLAFYAQKLGVGDWLLLGKGEERMGGRKRVSILADTFESILGAMYLDSGLERCRDFVTKVFDSKIEEMKKEVSGSGRPRDPKSRLQELCQQAWGTAPVYECVSEERVASQRYFEMLLKIKDVEVIRSRATSKKEATLLAAQELLQHSQAKIEYIDNLIKEKGKVQTKNLSESLGKVAPTKKLKKSEQEKENAKTNKHTKPQE
jgi:ribonuclease-3